MGFIIKRRQTFGLFQKLSQDEEMVDQVQQVFSIYDIIQKDETLKYIATSLKQITTATAEFQVVVIVSLIEILIIKKPDPNRYHIEDSIKKQFVLKVGILINSFNKAINLEESKLKLRELYDQRSNIAHGNFKEFQKQAEKTHYKEDSLGTYSVKT